MPVPNRVSYREMEVYAKARRWSIITEYVLYFCALVLFALSGTGFYFFVARWL